MEKILNITDRLEEKRRKREMEENRQRIETLEKIVLCSSCHFRCAMCGHHLNATDPSCPASSSSPGFTLCETCQAEFETFQEIKSGEGHPDALWHNEEWIDLWSAWLEYHKAINEFRNSTEYKQSARLLTIDD